MWEKGWRKEAKKARLGRRRLRTFYIRVALATILLVMTLGGVAWVSRASFSAIKNLTISSTGVVSQERVREIAEAHSNTPLFLLFGRANALLYPRGEITRAIEALDPKIATVDVSAVALDSIVITIEERKPAALWCGSAPALSLPCYFLDGEGFIFAEAPLFSGPVFLHYYGPILDSTPLRSTFLEPKTFQTLRAFLSQVQELGLDVESLVVRDEYDYEVRLKGGAMVLVARADDLASVLENLSSVLASETFKSKGVLALQYIDLRFGNKVYYRYAGETRSE